MKSFLRETLATIVGLSIVILVGLFAVGCLLMLGTKVVHHRGVLSIDLSEPLSDRGDPGSPMALLQGREHAPLALHDAVDALRAAAKDDAIEAVYLHGGVTGDVPLLRELRSALADVRAAKKPIVAFFTDYDEKVYYLASLADRVYIAPIGSFAMDGLAAQVLYYGALFQRIGVEVQVARSGEYKSAPEPYTAAHMSAENREQIAELLADLSDVLLEEVGQSRGVGVEKLRSIVRGQSYLTAEEALRANLVDRVASFADVLDELREITHADEDEDVDHVTLEKYAAAHGDRHRGSRAKGEIAVVFAEGEIVDGEDSKEVGGDTVARELRALRTDDDVKAVVLRINSPGGSAAASEAILSEVDRLRVAGKPVVASMAHVAASGGYWIASLADAIVAHPDTITGSIGVFYLLPNGEKLVKELELSNEVVKTGPHADALSVLRHKEPEELAILQHHVDEIYEQFLDHVAKGRKLSRDRVNAIARGRVWSGKEALRLGLVDSLGGLDDAIRIAAEKADLDPDCRVRFPRKEVHPLEALLELVQGEEEDQPIARALSLPEDLRAAARTVARYAREGAHLGARARLPFDLLVR